MKKKLTHREQLFELSRIYKISEIKNYINRKKNLTTSQLEHILRKNNISIPREINTNFFGRNIKTISRAFSKSSSNL